MHAYRLFEAGGPDKLVAVELPVPAPGPGQVRIRVRAFGLNRSEWFTRRGDSPTVKLPRVLGIECVGEVDLDGDGLLSAGQTVAAMMGGMGRQFDGSYAEYTVVPRACVFPLETGLPWDQLAALPEMLQTTHGSLTTGLGALPGETLLIRGGTSSVGLATLSLAKGMGLRVFSTTRSMAKADFLRESGADGVIVETGQIAEAVRAQVPGGVDRVLELIGATTLRDSLQCVRPGGVVCMTGILGGAWVLNDFHPMGDIPTGVRLTSYSGGNDDITVAKLQDLVSRFERGELRFSLGPVLPFAKLQEAHRLMDDNRANGKIVITVP